jgi:enolase
VRRPIEEQKMTQFTDVQAAEILDSRGNPTLAVTLRTADGLTGRAGVPSGASTGAGEAVELRDGDPRRYGGRGVLGAVAHVNGEIRDLLQGRAFAGQQEVDEALIALDATADKSRLGANATVGASMAAARIFAAERGEPLWRSLAPDGVAAWMPVPHFNVVNGGAHAAGTLEFQEFMIAPLGAPSEHEAVRAGAEVYRALRGRLTVLGHATGLGDEGGFAPGIGRVEDVLDVLVASIKAAGYTPGRTGVAIALDPAANGFYQRGRYHVDGQELSSAEMIEWYASLTERYPIWSVEDGLAEDDWDGWIALTARLGDRVQIVGDDIFVTNPAVITKAIEAGIGNAALIKVNQIGTVTETLEAMAVCRRAGYSQMISHRSGETTDDFIADLAVGSGCGQIKSGAPARGERVAKYNRLTEIETESKLPYGI